MPRSLKSLLIASAAFIASATAQVATQPINPQLVGTWSTKSNKVFTGPGFYDPTNEKMFEPSLTGFSYSFTADGYYEEAYYRAVSNPTQPQCPQGIMQWQHGQYYQAANGSLILTPFAVDGRQLLSNPCSYQQSIYTRYNQSELLQRYEVYTDPYHNILRLNLYEFNGAPLNPMYLAYSPPQMLPTQTLNPTTATSTGGAKATGSKAKRGMVEEVVAPLNRNALMKRREPVDADKWWWIGAGMTAVGGVGYLCF
ncbi:MAG: Reversal of tor2 lethality [Pycnora praestabilis]|nr:MAG: Reversal of tor2 lethality [Pycnora praestabilis]